MANLFEKYGIKDVADVTIYRIEKKEETYESQRKLGIASILKGSVELKTVYPFKDGRSEEEGFEAYVFTDADILTGANYDCDDENPTNITVTKQIAGSFKIDGTAVTTEPSAPVGVNFADGASAATIESTVLEGFTNTSDFVAGNPTESVVPDGAEVPLGVNYANYQVAYTMPDTWSTDGLNTVTFVATAVTNIVVDSEDSATGAFATRPSSAVTTKDPNKYPGTHEYSYAEQAFMLFAKRQNLIGVTGTRYEFNNIEELMAGLAFEDCYALSPNSSERVVVLGFDSNLNDDRDNASWTDADYDVNEINETLNNLTGSFTAKAYDVTYGSYAELVVEDEMGYYNPKFLGTSYNKTTKKVEGNYASVYASKIDSILANAQMWGDGVHFSINDAIDALRQVQKKIDSDNSSTDGIKDVYGGYRVSSILTQGTDDSAYNYTYYRNSDNSVVNLGTSKYALNAVMDELNALAYVEGVSGSTVGVDYTDEQGSNRAIYVNVGDANVAASSYIYLLHNKNYRKLNSDTEGVFTFADQKGNKVYYQDKIFAKTEYLAIVVVGTKGFVFVVNRNGTKDVSKIAWMVSDGDFVTDKAAKALVANGLIHTTNITVNNETFEATCAVKKIAVRKTKKITNRYTPVLFLDTLKISTIEQTAEEVYATGGRGNSNLIGWDFGKNINLSIQDALFTPASMSAMLGSYDGDDFRKGIKDTNILDRTEKCIAPRSFIVPAGNQNGTPTEADKAAQAVYIDPNTMEPYADGTPIAQGETFLKYTRSVAYNGQSLGKTIEISADKFPGTYKVVGDTFIKPKNGGAEERFQFVIPQAKFQSGQTITLEAQGDASVFDMNMTVLKPDDGVMMRLIQYDVVENTEENDGSTMVKGTENLNLLDDAELYRVDTVSADEVDFIGATEY